jgi:hypothetical protein
LRGLKIWLIQLKKWKSMPLGQVREISPVFIVGAGRSGTTPMQLALNMHPSLGVYGETQAFLSHRRFGVPSDAAELRRLVRHWHHIVADQTPHKELMQEQSLQHRLSRAQSYAEVLNTILGTIAAREHKARWGEKTPSHIFRLAAIRSCFPQSRVIHMIRDPRGTVCSTIQAFTDGAFTDWRIYVAARYWSRAVRVHQLEMKEPSPSYLLVRHEQFVTSPESTLKDVCAFLGLEYVPDLLKFHKTAAQFMRKTSSGELPTRHALTLKPMDASRAEAWRKVLSPRQIRLIESVVRDEMGSLGYEPDCEGEDTALKGQVAYYSAMWTMSETRRVALREAKARYWAMQRMMELGESGSWRPEGPAKAA